MGKLFIAEKPSQAKDIAAVLGAIERGDGYIECRGDITVTWGFGHLLELAEPESYGEQFKKWSMDSLPVLPETWKMDVKKDASKQFNSIKRLLKQTQHVVIATDADREGELIAREILDHCQWKGTIERLWLSALDEASIKKALASLKPGAETENLYHAGRARSYADWMVGMNMTRAITLLAQKAGHDGVFSVGRVQTPALALVFERDETIANFTPVAFWDLLIHTTHGDVTFGAKWIPDKHIDEEGRCLDKSYAASIAALVKGQEAKVTKFDKERKKQAAPLPFSLSSLQMEAGRLFSLSASQVLDIAQSLYESRKATTYPRTDCNFLPESQHIEANGVLAAMAKVDPSIAGLVQGADAARKSKVWNDAKVTAHHAIIPTAAEANIADFTDNERKVYDLIRRRYLAQFYPDMEYDQTNITLLCESQQFKASGRVVVKPGWQVVMKSEDASDDGQEEADSQQLPVLPEGTLLPVEKSELQEKKTKPPLPYTEGTLIQAMKNVGRNVDDEALKKMLRETHGIGTEATRANIIETLVKRGYIERKGKKKTLATTPKAKAFLDALPDVIKSPEITARWESGLEQIASGKVTFAFFMEKQRDWLGKVIAKAQAGGYVIQQAAPPEGSPACPLCQKPMKKRKSQHGDFWGCTGYPACNGTVRIEAPAEGKASAGKEKSKSAAKRKKAA